MSTEAVGLALLYLIVEQDRGLTGRGRPAQLARVGLCYRRISLSTSASRMPVREIGSEGASAVFEVTGNLNSLSGGTPRHCWSARAARLAERPFIDISTKGAHHRFGFRYSSPQVTRRRTADVEPTCAGLCAVAFPAKKTAKAIDSSSLLVAGVEMVILASRASVIDPIFMGFSGACSQHVALRH